MSAKMSAPQKADDDNGYNALSINSIHFALLIIYC